MLLLVLVGLAACTEPPELGGLATEEGGSTGEPIPERAVLPPAIDLGDSDRGCDIFTQDCPVGMKCALYSSDGGTDLDATRCVGLAPNPVGKREPCWALFDGDSPTGIDNCERGQLCWDVDRETGIGTCLAMCEGSAGGQVYCSDPREVCAIGKDLLLCMPVCNPLDDECPPGCGCYVVEQLMTCVPDDSGDMGAYGDPCWELNTCDPGLLCVSQDYLPGCESDGCCTQWCDTRMPQCPDAELGVECVPWYEEGTAPPGEETIGVCVKLPP